MEDMLKEFKEETILFVLLGLVSVGIILLAVSADIFKMVWSFSIGTGLLVVAYFIYKLYKRNSKLSIWVLVLSCFVANLLIVTWGGIGQAVSLFVIPIGLITMLVGVSAGAVAATICTLFLFFSPVGMQQATQTLRFLTAANIWATIGLVWLALRPGLTLVQWAWTGYKRSQELIEESRELQGQLSQSMEDLKQANIQLTRLNQLAQTLRLSAENERRTKERFVANVSHELRTPLNMITGFCEMILQVPEAYGQKIPEALLSDLKVVLRNGIHLSSLINDVLDLSQVDAGQIALLKEQVSLSEIVEAAVIAINPLYQSKSLYLKTDIPENLPPIFCDRTRVREVLLNLLSNAGRFTEKGGVLLKVTQEGKNIVVSVADTGPGIADEDKAKLFQPFQQLDITIHRRYAGTGLGLSISKSLVELHDGKMWVESELGHGTVFYFSLPIEPPSPLESNWSRWINPFTVFEKRDHSYQIPAMTIRPRLVVVERGAVLQNLLARYYRNVEVVPAPTLEAALQDVTNTPAKALLVNDAQVSEMLQRLTETTFLPLNTPVILCSVPGMEQFGGNLGAIDYLIKPISRESLLATLDRLQTPVKTILLVDDDLDALKLFRRMMTSARRGYHVVRATNGQQALNILRHQQIDVILLDLIMPEMDGFQFLAIKNREPDFQDIPVILISARDPQGHPIASNALAVTRSGGLSVKQILACMEALIGVLAPIEQPAGPALLRTPLD